MKPNELHENKKSFVRLVYIFRIGNWHMIAVKSFPGMHVSCIPYVLNNSHYCIHIITAGL